MHASSLHGVVACTTLALAAACGGSKSFSKKRTFSKRVCEDEPPSIPPKPPFARWNSNNSDNMGSNEASGSQMVDTDSDDEHADYNASCDEDGNDQPQQGAMKLWSKLQFPEGTIGHKNWDMANLVAAQEWCCPCKDRANCISNDRLRVLDLYEHRKNFRLTAHLRGGFRDACRDDLMLRYDGASKTFVRSFKVGPLVDCCAASAGLAAGVSFQTWSNARADVRLQRPDHKGRVLVRARAQSMQRAHLNAYIRELRGGLEGPKGAADPKDKWTTGRMTLPKRWEQYTRRRMRKGLPVIGSKSLFAKLWKEHTEIVEISAKGHPKCDKYASDVPFHPSQKAYLSLLVSCRVS